jgi:hypothetical protein
MVDALIKPANLRTDTCCHAVELTDVDGIGWGDAGLDIRDPTLIAARPNGYSVGRSVHRT